MTDGFVVPLVVAATGLLACAATHALIALLRRADVLDQPNERSSHRVPTPRGGGIAVIGAILLAWVALGVAGSIPANLVPVAGGAVVLAAVSWFDDLRGVPPGIRLLVQFLAVAVGLAAVTPKGLLFQGWLPPVYSVATAAVAWVWFVNLFNFMDGIDGLDGSEAAAIALGLVLFATLGAGRDPVLAGLAAPIAAAAVGFLVWNWAPARIFLGDVGSVPLGYVLGFLLMTVSARGHWKIAVILPLYFVADATITLVRRLARGERIWQAHREHFYQKAVQRGLGHATVVRRVIAADIVLIGLGWAAENGWGLAAIAAAVVVVAILLANLAGLLPQSGRPIPAATRQTEEPP